jgi:hypothetical protein
VFIIAYSVGAILVKINTSQADFIKKDFGTKIKGINQYGIFANNFKVALGMFIPGFGIPLGGFYYLLQERMKLTCNISINDYRKNGVISINVPCSRSGPKYFNIFSHFTVFCKGLFKKF